MLPTSLKRTLPIFAAAQLRSPLMWTVASGGVVVTPTAFGPTGIHYMRNWGDRVSRELASMAAYLREAASAQETISQC